jgi:hypothetical protein
MGNKANLLSLLQHGGGASKVTSTIKEKVAHVKADAVAAGQKITHPTNPAAKQAATQEVSPRHSHYTMSKYSQMQEVQT